MDKNYSRHPGKKYATESDWGEIFNVFKEVKLS